MKYYNDMGVDVTLIIRDTSHQLLTTLNENLALKTDILEQSKKLETRAATIKRLRQQLKEKEETICQLEKKTPQTKEETPLEPTELET